MALVFDVSSDMAMFRKSYTTTSAVSLPFPPPTALAGLVGAIVGLNHGSSENPCYARFWEDMAGLQVAVGIRQPGEWFSTAVNLMKFKSANATMGEHIQVKHQFVRRPEYRVYVKGETEVYQRLAVRLKKEEFAYTPYLGLAYCIADIEFVGEFPCRAIEDYETQRVALNTVVPNYGDVEIDVIASGAVHREVVPFSMDKERRLLETVTVFYPEIGAPGRNELIISKRDQVDIEQVGRDKVAWFRSW